MQYIEWMKIVALGIAAAAAMPAAGNAQIMDRGTLPGGPGCSAIDVNSNGTSIGICTGSHASGGHAVGVYQLFDDQAPTPLPVLSAGKGCSPDAISDTGVADFVAGRCEDAAGDVHAVRWAADSQGRFTSPPQILSPLQGLLGLGSDIDASISAINQYGAVVGDSIGANGRHRAVIWRAGSTVAVQLPDPPAPLLATVGGCSAVAISNIAPPRAAGTCQLVSGADVSNIAVRWVAGTGGSFAVAVLGGIGGDCGAVDINAGGDTVGSCADAAGDATAILWASNTTAPFIIVAADQSMVAGITDNRVVAGSYVTGDGYLHTYVGTPLSSPVLDDIGTLAGGHNCGVAGLDGAGNVVATCDTDTLPALAARYTPIAGLEALGTLGGPFSGTTGVSIGGTLVGNSMTADGYGHAFILAPGVAIANRVATRPRTVPVGGSAKRGAMKASASAASSAKDHPNCAAWIANGFASSTFYTEAQKRQYCPISSGLDDANADDRKDDPRCAAWAANGFLTSSFYTAAQKRQYCPQSFRG